MPTLQGIAYLGQNNKINNCKANNTRQENLSNEFTNKPASV
ncbi:hypothetical protein SynMVIR181_00938 [Synechococcus sp. MVIR-18-1]|nr:hypothetical protein SynMVIR181_00938 [Synechococcus sp. MVIR-18-1]